MSFLRVHCSRVLWTNHRRYASKAGAQAANSKPANSPPKSEDAALSSCVPGTVLTGVNYLKGQEPVVAQPDEEYPPWLWELLKPKAMVDDGPGGQAEKRRLRAQNRQRIKDQNFMKTQ